MPQLTIPDDTYERLARRAAALNVTVEQLVTPALERVAEAEAANGHPPAGARGIGSFPSYEEWSKALQEWVDSHPKRDTLADDSRESIYADDRAE